MRLLDNLRHAEQKGVKAVRRGMERAREEWGDMERRMRQRWRVYPQKLQNPAPAQTHEEHELDMVDQGIPAGIGTPAETEERKPIVSIHGRDVREADHADRFAA